MFPIPNGLKYLQFIIYKVFTYTFVILQNLFGCIELPNYPSSQWVNGGRLATTSWKCSNDPFFILSFFLQLFCMKAEPSIWLVIKETSLIRSHCILLLFWDFSMRLNTLSFASRRDIFFVTRNYCTLALELVISLP